MDKDARDNEIGYQLARIGNLKELRRMVDKTPDKDPMDSVIRSNLDRDIAKAEASLSRLRNKK